MRTLLTCEFVCSRMPRTVTTLSVHPDRAEALRQIRDSRELPNMDAALETVLSEVDADV